MASISCPKLLYSVFSLYNNLTGFQKLKTLSGSSAKLSLPDLRFQGSSPLMLKFILLSFRLKKELRKTTAHTCLCLNVNLSLKF